MWQIGVMAVLFIVLNVANSLNNVPAFNVFMPLTANFIFGYIRVVTLIIIIIVAFALSFHFLMIDKPAFETLSVSLIKTLVWMLGDLGYDDTFLSEDTPMYYPVQVNILFVLFVTTIGGLVFNLVLRDPNDHLEDIKNKAAFYRADAFMKLHLLIDDCLPCLRKKFSTSGKVVSLHDKKKKTMFYSGLHTTNIQEVCHSSCGAIETGSNIAQIGDNNETEACTDQISLLKILIEKVDGQKENISELSRAVAKLRESSS